jgi:hypothetical protein
MDRRGRLLLVVLAFVGLAGCFTRIKDSAGLVLVPGTGAPAYLHEGRARRRRVARSARRR